MVQRDAFKILQDILKEHGIKMSLEDIQTFMKCLEEMAIVVGEQLNEKDVCRLVSFLEIRKKETKSRQYKVLNGEHAGEMATSPASTGVIVKSTKAFNNKTKKNK